jgi:LacI family transcriptional regulator
MKDNSIKNIADSLGISKTTVSFVMNGKGDKYKISKNTQARILELARQLNYRPNPMAQGLSMGKTFFIGIIVPDISNPFFSRICRSIEDYANAAGYQVTFGSTDENPLKERELIEMMAGRKMDGIILASTNLKTPTIKKLIRSDYPMVFFDRMDNLYPNRTIVVDNEGGAFKLVNALAQKGHQRIGLVYLTSHLSPVKDRIKGYKKALEANRIAIDKELMLEVDFNHIKAGVSGAIETLLNLRSPVSAIFFINNVLAAEGIWIMNMNHKALVNQVEFASFDNLDLFDYSVPVVTSLAQPVDDIARHCVESLLNLIQKDQEPLHLPLILDAMLIER